MKVKSSYKKEIGSILKLPIRDIPNGKVLHKANRYLVTACYESTSAYYTGKVYQLELEEIKEGK